MKKVSDVIQPRDIYWVDAGDSVRKVVKYMCERKTGAVAVKENDDLAGIFSERDVLHRVVAEERDPDAVKVRDVMSTSLIFIPCEDTVQMAKALMFRNRVRHLIAVGKNNQYKGLLSMRDLIEADMSDQSELVHKLNDAYYEEAYKSRWRVSSNRVIIETYEEQVRP